MNYKISYVKKQHLLQIFLVLYFWYVLLFVLSAVYILYRISTIALPQLRALTLKVKVNEGTGQHGTVNRVLGRCDIGDWFLLEQLGQNVNPRFFRQSEEPKWIQKKGVLEGLFGRLASDFCLCFESILVPLIIYQTCVQAGQR